MRERPILFSGPMVRAIIEGRKTQTRRVVQPQPELTDGAGFKWKGWLHGKGANHAETVRNFARQCCPYGVPGDRLWVRETWHTDEPDLAYARAKHEDAMSGSPICYAADAVHDNAGCIWRPSIHMPRWASRITLEIVSVRVERVQEISEGEALAEGVLQFDGPNTFTNADGVQSIYIPGMGYASDAFIALWDSINAKRAPWESNPWVWVTEFRRVGE